MLCPFEQPELEEIEFKPDQTDKVMAKFEWGQDQNVLLQVDAAWGTSNIIFCKNTHAL